MEKVEKIAKELAQSIQAGMLVQFSSRDLDVGRIVARSE